jgi:hypothetical protein
MKIATVFFLLLLSPAALSQTNTVAYRSFHIENKEVVWIQVFHEEPLVDDLSKRLFEHLKNKVWIKNIKFEGPDIVAELNEYRPDYKRYGGKFTNTSSVIRTGKFAGTIRISFKDGKYRVVIEGITYEALQSSTGSGKATIEQHQVSGTLNDFALNNLRTDFKKRNRLNLDILHSSFKDSFTIKVNQVIDEDW